MTRATARRRGAARPDAGASVRDEHADARQALARGLRTIVERLANDRRAVFSATVRGAGFRLATRRTISHRRDARIGPARHDPPTRRRVAAAAALARLRRLIADREAVFRRAVSTCLIDVRLRRRASASDEHDHEQREAHRRSLSLRCDARNLTCAASIRTRKTERHSTRPVAASIVGRCSGKKSRKRPTTSMLAAT